MKKVNFMENREYFFHKRKAMAETEADEQPAAGEERPTNYGHHREQRSYPQQFTRGQKRTFHKRNGYPDGARYDEKQGSTGQSQGNSGFFDKISSSCNIESERPPAHAHRTHNNRHYAGSRGGNFKRVGRPDYRE